MKRGGRWLLVGVVLCGVVCGLLSPVKRTGVQPASAAQYFPETGFSLSDAPFAAYFAARGGVLTFGYPISRPFTLRGFRFQFFQRHVMEALPGDSRVSLLGLLDEGSAALAGLEGVTLPTYDPQLVAAAPDPSAPDYGPALLAFLLATVPNNWQGVPVGFLDTYLLPDQYSGQTDPVAQVLAAVEVLGLPASAPTPDPLNSLFVYQRFQRGVLHYDASTGLTQPLLLGDALRSVIERFGLLSYWAADSPRSSGAGGGQDPGTQNLELALAFQREDLPGPGTPGASVVPGAASSGPRSGASNPPAVPPDATARAVATIRAARTPVIAGAGSGAGTSSTGGVSIPSAPAVPVASPVLGPLHLSSIDPAVAAVGQDVLLVGSGFGETPGYVVFPGKLATPLVWADTNIVVTVPQGATSGDVRLLRTDGTYSNGVAFALPTTPTPTPTSPPTETPAPSLTPPPTRTATASPIVSPPTPSPSETLSPTPPPLPTAPPTSTTAAVVAVTATPPPTTTATATAVMATTTATPAASVTWTPSPSATSTPTRTASPTATRTPMPTPSPSASATSSSTP